MNAVIPGAGIAREPGTQEHGLEKTMVWPVFMLGWTAPYGIECARL